MAPVPGAWFRLEEERIKVFACALMDDVSGPPGTATDDALAIACGVGAVRLLRLQREGRKVMDAEDFLRGLPVPRGARIGPG